MVVQFLWFDPVQESACTGVDRPGEREDTMLWRKKLSLIPVVAVLFVSACAPAAAPAAAPTGSGAAGEESAESRAPVVVVYGNDSATFDPAFQAGSIGVDPNVFDTLLRQTADGVLEPGIATEWQQIDDSTWEFKIREGVTAHNGEVIDANDVAYSLNRVLDPEINATGHYRWLAGNMRMVGAEAVDDNTVHLITDGLVGGVPDFLWTWYILPQDHYSSTPLDVLAREPVGSGPYSFNVAEARRGQQYLLEANPNHWNGKPEVDQIVIKIIPELASRIAEFNTGAADLLWLAPPPDLQAEIDPEYGRVLSQQGMRRVILGVVFYNTPAMASKELRQALNYGVDVQTILDSLLDGATQRTGSFANPPNVAPTVQPYPYDPERARELLAEGGFVDSNNDGCVEDTEGNELRLKLQTPSGTWVLDSEVSQAVAADLGEVGICVEVETLEFGIFISSLANAEATGDLWMQAASGGYGCQADLSDFSTQTQWQPGGWEPGEFDDVFIELTSTSDPDRRQELCFQLQEIMWEEAPLIFLYNDLDPYAISNRIEWQPYAHGRNGFSTMTWAD
jgi:peptide/nickel transport system substrate-binding protein